MHILYLKVQKKTLFGNIFQLDEFDNLINIKGSFYCCNIPFCTLKMNHH